MSLEPKLRITVNSAKKLKADRFLDVGCGDGTFSALLGAVLGADEMYGIEIAADAANRAKEKGINCTCLDIDQSDFPFDRDYFAAIYAGDIIEHLFSPDHLLSEIYRVLKPTGSCIITTPNLSSWHSRLHLLMGFQPYAIPISSNQSNRSLGSFLHRVTEDHSYLHCSGGGGRGHIQFFTLKALKELLQLHGFKIVNIRGSPDVPTFHIPAALYWAVLLIERLNSACFPSLASRLIIWVTK